MSDRVSPREMRASSSVIRDLMPPVARRFLNRVLGQSITYKGPYETWEAALATTRGYDDGKILTRVQTATELVLAGLAGYEQDGIAMRGISPPDNALSALLLAAVLDNGKLNVLDFGGGLASHYLRWRAWLRQLPNLHWRVIEQPHFVRAGERLFADIPTVSFNAAIDQDWHPNAVLASSVLQYLPDPTSVLEQLVALRPRVIVIDRTPFSGSTQIMTQRVPARLGSASYPLWVLSRDLIYSRLRQRYDLLFDFPSADAPLRVGRIAADYAGCAWRRRN